MSTYFTSDTHFGQQRTLELSKRPYDSVDAMDKDLINKWNKTVKETDTVYHLGDFGDFNVIKHLNGNVILICGNYEDTEIAKFKNTDSPFSTFKNMLIEQGFDDVVRKKAEIKVGDFNVWATHCPENCDKTKFNLFGHIHKLCMVKKYGLNVGVDSHNFTPIDVDTVLFYKTAIEKFYDQNVFE